MALLSDGIVAMMFYFPPQSVIGSDLAICNCGANAVLTFPKASVGCCGSHTALTMKRGATGGYNIMVNVTLKNHSGMYKSSRCMTYNVPQGFQLRFSQFDLYACHSGMKCICGSGCQYVPIRISNAKWDGVFRGFA